MEGACVYIDQKQNSVLVMYKEVEKNNVLYLIYSNKSFFYQFITTKLLTYLLPHNCIHILYSLPYLCHSLEITLNNWILLGINKLNNLNILEEKKNNNNLNLNMKFINFNEKFKKTN